MNINFAKSYNPLDIEDKWYNIWIKNNIYAAPSVKIRETYSILMPPPNVTGILHFGHVLNHTIQDLFIRWKRMHGYQTCWFPGYDHAGIATHAKVEAMLKEQGLSRYDIGREKFLEHAWQWKEKYGGIILKQLKKLGISCDWNRLLFTMDESASNAVQQAFIKLFEDGLIYRGKKIINWSPLSQTALSDEEVEFRELNEKLYTFRYYFVDDKSKYLKVATVRPETIYGDVAVAVNPNDERYKNFIGKKVIVPYVGREVEIIADDYADPQFGTGCVKITPAHDPNDYIVGERHNLPQINTLNPDGTMNELTGEFQGLDRFEARKAILKKLEENNLIEKIEDYTHNVGFSQRGGEPIEPYLSDQWFVKMNPLAEIALQPVLDGRIKFHPEHWVKTYEHWLTNIRDWCISRQLWWGHRIPVYYTEDGQFIAANSEKEARIKLNLSPDTPLRQDEDVLDTWFSSWLWPLTTMGWLADGKTEDTIDLRTYLPTDLLVTAPDIIFFWVARMIMATMYFKNEIPFKDVYFTSTIRDEQGRKLSKSLGNSPDPLTIIEKYGTDANRFTIIYLSPLGQDVKMDIDIKAQDIPSMEIGRNFANKVWNAGRFLLMKKEIFELDDCCPANQNKKIDQSELTFADKWILSRFHSTLKNIHNALDNFKVNDYSKMLYDFIWRDFCDWYIEIVKIHTNNSTSPSYKRAYVNFVISLFEDILKILHPVMPFITEEIWHLLNNRDIDQSISLERIPDLNMNLIDSKIEEKFEYLQLLVEEVRRLRANMNISPSKKLPLIISSKDKNSKEFIDSQLDILQSLTNSSRIESSLNALKPKGSLASVIRETELFLILEGEIDIEKEKQRLDKEKQRLENNIKTIEQKLSNAKFLNNAAPEVIQREKEKLVSMQESLKKVTENLRNLK